MSDKETITFKKLITFIDSKYTKKQANELSSDIAGECLDTLELVYNSRFDMAFVVESPDTMSELSSMCDFEITAQLIADYMSANNLATAILSI